jgi:putative ABC transport system substrate-binding protein
MQWTVEHSLALAQVAWSPFGLWSRRNRPQGSTVSAILLGGTAEDAAPLLRALIEGLRDLGLVDGRNLKFESRYADVRLERLPDLAAQLVHLRVDAIVTGSNPYVAAAQRATTTIPIVFVASADPVGAGFIASLAKPGGNITGLTIDASPEVFAKHLELLAEVVPNLTRVGVLRQADREVGGFAELQAAARRLNVTLDVVDVRDLGDLASAFATMTGKRVGAVIVLGPVFYLRRATARGFGAQTSTACNSWVERVCGGGAADVIRTELAGSLSSCR